MCELHARHPHYGFAQHKGYPTALHLDALRQHGPIAEHRRSFAPVAACLLAAQSQGDLGLG
jgi:ribonuclease HII